VGEKRVILGHEGGMRFVARTSSGHDVVVDNAVGDSGPRPTEFLDNMAKKRQIIDRYSVEVTGTQREKAPNVFLTITVIHMVEGNVETAAVVRSIELSATKYCTVSAQIAAGPARISHRYSIKRPGAGGAPPTEESGEVVVTGPMRDVLAD
jgi:putative redox protein